MTLGANLEGQKELLCRLLTELEGAKFSLGAFTEINVVNALLFGLEVKKTP